MIKLKYKLLKPSFRWHNMLVWLCFIGLLVWAFSGLLHPIKGWVGPKEKAFSPPSLKLSASLTQQIPGVLAKHNIIQAILVKIVATQLGPLLQVTEQGTQPRRYFNLHTGVELIDYDQTQAVWLARYYSGLTEAKITSVELQTAFDGDYSWVKRLLPIYKVQFATEDQQIFYVYTETNTLAEMTNKYKSQLQALFRTLHVLDWLDEWELLRVALISVFMLALLAMPVTGLIMLYFLPNRSSNRRRKLHHTLAVWLSMPLFLFTASALYHLIQYSFMENPRGLKLPKAMTIPVTVPVTIPMTVPSAELEQSGWFGQNSSIALSAASLIRGQDDMLLYRLTLAEQAPTGGGKSVNSGHGDHNGHGKSSKAVTELLIYLDAMTGQSVTVSEEALSLTMAQAYGRLAEHRPVKVSKITHFDQHYSFYNRRLPVWQFDYDSASGGTLMYIDPATGILVDRLTDAARYEGYSFSFLHMWHFLRPMLDKINRDVVLSLLMIFSIIMALLGFTLKRRRRK